MTEPARYVRSKQPINSVAPRKSGDWPYVSRTGLLAGFFPAVVLLHGSGGLHPGTAFVFREIGRGLADDGYVALIPHFVERTGHEPGQPFKEGEIRTMCDSVQDAMEFAVANAPIDPDRIGMIGYSMGANIAFFRSFHDPRIRAIVAVSAYLPVESQAKFPPILILLGSGDRNTPPARLKQFEAVLKERQVPYGSHVYRGIGHNFDIPTWDDAGRRAATFFNRFLKVPNAKQLTRSRGSKKASVPTAGRTGTTAPATKGDAKSKSGAGTHRGAPAKPRTGDAKPESTKSQPIEVDAIPVPGVSEAKSSGEQPIGDEPRAIRR